MGGQTERRSFVMEPSGPGGEVPSPPSGEGELEQVLPAHDNLVVNHAPSTARAIADLIKEMGAEDYEPRVVYQILEFITTYVQGVVDTAEEYAEHADRSTGEVRPEDIALAIGKSKGPQVDSGGVFEPVLVNGFPSKPNLQLLRAMAEKVNAKELPQLSKKAGLSLPGDESCLTAQNFEVNL